MAIEAGSFVGGAYALKYAKRDLPRLEQVIGMTRGKTACVQAGGNLGVWPKRLAQSFGVVFTFEPAADLFALLCRNAPEPNIVKLQAALGDERGLVGLSRERRDGKTNNHEGITHVSGDGIVPTLRIDDLGLSACDLVYLDLEGYELFALHGARLTIERCRPVLAVEINKSLGFYGLEASRVYEFIYSHAYREAAVLGPDHVFVPEEWV